MEKIVFPKGFLWGGATAAHQVEGGNVNNDWFIFEQKPGKILNGVVSGDSCDHYNRFTEDFKLLKKLNHNAHRFSIEWSRVEPAKDYFSTVEIDHYIKVVKSLKDLKIEPMVTLHHFTTPVWMANLGGWENPDVVNRFEKFTRVMAEALGKDVKLWIPINEPVVYAVLSFMDGEYAPGKKGFLRGFRVVGNMLKAHALSYRAIKERNPKAQVGFNKHMRVFDPLRENNSWDIRVAGAQDKNFNMDILDALNTGKSTGQIKVAKRDKDLIRGAFDFMSLNYYARDRIKFSPLSPGRLFGKTVVPEGAETSHEGATGERPEGEVYPHGIYRLLKTLSQYEKPLYVAENGIGTNNDKARLRYVARHIAEVGNAIKDGMDVRGYLHWSTLDNFEWAEGYEMRFGMIHVDFETQKRTVKETGKFFSDLAKKNCIDKALLKKYGVTL